MDSKVISKRGYVIRKSILDNKEQSQIKKELTMVPYTLPGFQQDNKKFKLYQENENKFYLPKAYALQKFGPPDVNKLENSGEDIDIEFSGSMRDNQIPVIETFISESWQDPKLQFCSGFVCFTNSFMISPSGFHE